MDNNNLTGNISTVAVWAYVILAPYIAQYISQDVFIALVGIIIAVWSSANPNSFGFLNNEPKECSCNCFEEAVLNEEYTTSVDDEGGC